MERDGSEVLERDGVVGQGSKCPWSKESARSIGQRERGRERERENDNSFDDRGGSDIPDPLGCRSICLDTATEEGTLAGPLTSPSGP